jgi:ribosome-associated heat shock protein Hsp15
MGDRLSENPTGMRLDKWLWCARFYKTRPLAAAAVEGGKVQAQGQRGKPGKEIRIGSHLQIHKDGLTWDVEVRALPAQRRPASEAAHFYAESETGRAHRAQDMERLRLARLAEPLHTDSKPNKRDRRLIQRFKAET